MKTLKDLDCTRWFPSEFMFLSDHVCCFHHDSTADACISLHLHVSPPPPPPQMLTDTASSGGSASLLIGTYHRLFGTTSHPSIVRYSDFSDVASYLIQKDLHTSIAAVRGGQSQSPGRSEDLPYGCAEVQ